jgi:hypothetical protein
MDANAELNPPVLRHAGVALDHGNLDLDRAARGVDDAAELDDCAIAGALDDPAAVRCDACVTPAEADKATRKSVCRGCGQIMLSAFPMAVCSNRCEQRERRARARPESAKYRDKYADIARRPTPLELDHSWLRARELDLQFEAATFERRHAFNRRPILQM